MIDTIAAEVAELTTADVPNMFTEAEIKEQRLLWQAEGVGDDQFHEWFDGLRGSAQVRLAIGLCMTRARKKGSDSCADFLKLVRQNLD